MTVLAPARPSYLAYTDASDVEHFAWWAEEHCRHFLGPFAGLPLVFEPWQLDHFGEILAVDGEGLPYWTTVLEILSRKEGKTTSFAALGTYHVDQEDDGPNVGLAATSDEQASELFDAIDAFIAASPYLKARFHVRDYEGEIARTDAGGYLRRMRMNWRRLHGKNQSRLLADELHAWTTPNLRRCWEALTTGDGARPNFQALCITSEGEPDPTGEGIMAGIVLANERDGDVERHPGLTISRNHDSRTLVIRYHARMPDADPAPVREAYRRWRDGLNAGDPDAPELRERYEDAARRCVLAAKEANPATWITEDYLHRKAIDPKISRSSFLRYHAGVAAASEEAWVQLETWRALGGGEPVEPRRAVCLGADGSRTHDTTAIAWAAERGRRGTPGYRVQVGALVFSASSDAPHHRLHDGRIDYDDVEEELLACFTRWKVIAAGHDPRYLDRSAEIVRGRLRDDVIAEIQPGSSIMRDAIAAFDRGINDGVVEHTGDPVLEAHVIGARAIRDTVTGEIRKLAKANPAVRIDAAVAVAMAYFLAVTREDHVYNRRGLATTSPDTGGVDDQVDDLEAAAAAYRSRAYNDLDDEE